MTLKDGSSMPVVAVDKKTPATVVSTESRLAQLEKKVMAAITTGKAESDGEDDLELFGGGAPKCVKIAAADKKRKRELSANTVSVFNRMSPGKGPSTKRRSTEQEIDDEFNQE